MGKCDVIDQLDAIALADAKGGRGPLTDAVQGYDCCLVKGTGEKCAGGVALVMIGEEQASAGNPFPWRP